MPFWASPTIQKPASPSHHGSGLSPKADQIQQRTSGATTANPKQEEIQREEEPCWDVLVVVFTVQKSLVEFVASVCLLVVGLGLGLMFFFFFFSGR